MLSDKITPLEDLTPKPPVHRTSFSSYRGFQVPGRYCYWIIENVSQIFEEPWKKRVESSGKDLIYEQVEPPSCKA
jgi:hypothetical protein